MQRPHNGPFPPTVFGLVFAIVASLTIAAPGAAQDSAGEIDRKIDSLRRFYEQRIGELTSSYEHRIRALESEIGGLKGELGDMRPDSPLETMVNDLVQEAGRAGIAEFSQTTVFDNTFNPAVSLTSDFILAASDRDDSFGELNRFILRDVELGIVGRVDPLVAYYVYIHYEPEEVELEEAYGIADDWLPDTFTLKFGRYNVDFGKQSPIHEHDLPYVDKPGVLQEFLGGSLRGTGIELHHWFAVGDTSILRWSVGIVNELDGDAHVVVGPLAGEHEHEEDGAEPFGERDIDDFGFNARVTALLEVGDESTLQLGASVAWAPEARSFVPGGSGAFDGVSKEEESLAVDLERIVWGFDATFKWLDPASGEGLTLAGEFLFSHAEFHSEEDGGEGALPLGGVAGDGVFKETSLGFYAYGEYFFDKYWSAGATFDWFERAEDSDVEWWDVGAFGTWRVDHFNRLRLEVRYVDDDLARDEYVVVMAQWIVLLGSHGHGIDW